MKKSSVIIFCVLALAILVSVPNKVLAKTKFITGKKISVDVGKKKTIEVIDTKNKKIKFKSSNKKVATVSKKGVVKGKKTGKAKVTVKVGKKKKVITVSVLPKKVSIISAQTVSSTAIVVKWNKLKEAKGYYVYYSTDLKGKFKKKKTTKNELKIDGLSGGEYYFKVKAYGNSNTLSAKYSDVKSAKIWKLLWSDEFNSKSLDTSVWTYETGQTGWGSEESQNYTAGDNIEFDGSNLVIVPRVKVPSTCKTTKIATVVSDPSGHLYTKLSDDYKSYFAKDKYAVTSTRIASKDKKEFRYGKIEIRAKGTAGNGISSLGWMLGNDVSTNTWPKCGEIGIFESINDKNGMTVISPTYLSGKNSNNNTFYDSGISQASGSTAFHTYAIEWTNNTITFYADGKKVGVYDPKKFSAIAYDETWVFDHPFYFIFNSAIGGNAAGDVDVSNWPTKKESGDLTIYEDRFYVDYVRVYE